MSDQTIATDERLADRLNRLLAAEQNSLFRHLDEADPYLDAKTFRHWAKIREWTHTAQDHARVVSDLIRGLGLSERPRPFQPSVADAHFLDLGSLLPKLIEETRQQIGGCDLAIAAAGGHTVARSALEGILAQKRAKLEQLESIQADLAK